MLDRKQVLAEIKEAHAEMRNLLTSLSPRQISQKVNPEWDSKDVLCHLIGWNFETAAEINRILQDKQTWVKKYESEDGEEVFNKKEIEKRKGVSFEALLEEWDDSFNKLIERTESLTDDEWSHQSGKDVWSEGKLANTPVTVWSLFDYEYEGKSHEAGHAVEIRRALL